MGKKKEGETQVKQAAGEDQLEKIKLDLIKRLEQKRFEYPHLVRAAGCTSSRDYLDGHIQELKEILQIHFGYVEKE